MSQSSNPLLFFYTEKSRTQNKEFDNLLESLRTKKDLNLEECKDYSAAVKLLEADDREYSVVLVHIHSTDRKLWRDLYYKTRANNKYSEVIVIVVDNDEENKIECGDVLSSGCFAYFQYTFSPEVLFGYIYAAQRKCDERRARTDFSRALNENSKSVYKVAQKIAEQLKIINYDNITITLLKKSNRTDQGYIRKLVYTNLSRTDEVNGVKWALLKPTGQDVLVGKILSGEIKRRVFPNPRTDDEIKDIFDLEGLTKNINSWIILPLQHDGKVIGLITLDGFHAGQFEYDKINEAALEQIANQSATAIRYAEQAEIHERLEEALNALNSSAELNQILENLAMQAGKLVEGLFSFIVMPNQAQSHLEYRGAWSYHEGNAYIKTITEMWPSPSLNAQKLGITGLAFKTRNRRWLENIRDESYQEEDQEAKNAYHNVPYVYEDESGVQRRIAPNSDIALPILLKNQNGSLNVLGVINVEHADPFAFTKDQIEALEQLAEFAAIAIQRRKKEEFVSQLYDFSEFPYRDDLSFDESLESLEQFLQRVSNNVQKLTLAKYVSVHVVKDNKSFCVGHSDAPQNIREGSRWGNPDTEGHTFWCIRNQKPVIINDTKKYSASPSDYRDMFGETYLRQNGTPIPINPHNDSNVFKALICIPMIIPGQKAVGVIWIHHEASVNYSDHEIDLLSKFANKIANLLYAVDKLTFLKIEKELISETDRELFLDKTVERARVYFGVGGAAIYEANHQTKVLDRIKSNIRGVPPFRKVGFKSEAPEGLAGNLMVGENKGDHLYGECWYAVKNYSDYVYAMRYTPDGKRSLGSVIGIRFPTNVPPEDALGIFIVNDKAVIPGEGGRIYDDSRNELIAFANLVAEGLKKTSAGNLGAQSIGVANQTSPETRYVDFLLITNGIMAAFLFWFASQPLELIGGYIFRADVKVFVSLLIWCLIMMFSPRLRKGSIIGFLLSVISGILTTWLGNLR